MLKTPTRYILILSAIILWALAACDDSPSTQHTQPDTPVQPKVKIKVPDFNVDSSYLYIETQVAFGPRVPNTSEHVACGDWLTQKLGSYADKVVAQTGVVTAYDGRQLNMRNIIGSFNPESRNRILLCAHWDTRPWADEDQNDQNKPILGANDGGSGVGVWLEVARQYKQTTFSYDVLYGGNVIRPALGAKIAGQ